MQFKFYIVSGLFSKLIRKFYISCFLSRENHCVSQNKHGYTNGRSKLKPAQILFSRPHWRDLKVFNYLKCSLKLSCIFRNNSFRVTHT